LGYVDFTVIFDIGVDIPDNLYIAVDYGLGVVYEPMTMTKSGNQFTISLENICL
jgi:hypothetical protein